MSLLDRIKENMFGLERGISDIVPGYNGYKQKELRREADKLLRETIAARMRTVKAQLDTLQTDLMGAGKIDLLDVTGSAATQLQTFIDRVRTASYGYGGFFDAVRIKEEDLDRAYQFDVALLDYAERIEAAITRAREGMMGEELPSLIQMIRDLAREANATFDRRKDFLNNTADVSAGPSL